MLARLTQAFSRIPFVRAAALAVLVTFTSALVHLAPSGTARAQGREKIFSIAVSGDLYSQKPAAQMNHYLRAALGQVPGILVIDPELPLDDFQPNDLLATCKQADEFLAKGKSGFENIEMDEAVKNLSRALGNFWKCAAYVGDGRQYVETLQYLGGSYIVKGEKSLGLEMFKKAVIFNQKAEFSTQTFPPDMADVYRQARDDVAKLATGSINVSSIPAGAEVYIDGMFVGIAPRTKDKVPVGNHFISVRRYGYMSDGARVDVVAGDEVTYQAQLLPTKKFQEYNRYEANVDLETMQDGVGATVAGLAKLMTAQEVLVSSVKREGGDLVLRSSLYDIAAGRKVNTASKTFDPDSPGLFHDIQAFVAALLKGEEVSGGPVGPVVPVGPEVMQGPPETAKQALAQTSGACGIDADCKKGERCNTGVCTAVEKEAGAPFYKTWWFWTIVGGAVVVAGGTTTAVLLLTGGENGGPTGTIGFKY